MIRDLLEGITPREVKQILQEMHPDLSRASKKYWLERGLKHAFPNTKLSELGLVRLNALKFKIVGEIDLDSSNAMRLQVDCLAFLHGVLTLHVKCMKQCSPHINRETIPNSPLYH